MDDRRSLILNALVLADGLAGEATYADRGRSPPCAGWDLAALLAHVAGQYHGFARALETGDAPLAGLAPVACSAESWSRCLGELQAALHDVDLDGRARIVELAPIPLPVRSVLRAQVLDTVVHSWDIARALDRVWEPPQHLGAEVAATAESIPAAASGPGRAFAVPLSPAGTV